MVTGRASLQGERWTATHRDQVVNQCRFLQEGTIHMRGLIKRKGLLNEYGMGKKLPHYQIGSHLLFAKISCMLREHFLAVAEIPEAWAFPGES